MTVDQEPEAGDVVLDVGGAVAFGSVQQMVTRARNGPGDTGEFTWWVHVSVPSSASLTACNVRLFDRGAGLQFERI